MATKKTTEDNQKTTEVKQKRGRPKKEPEKKQTETKKRKSAPVKKQKDSKPVGNGNLIPFNERSEEEQRAIRLKGGIASGVARRRKKELREFTRDFLMQEAVPQLKGNMDLLGVEVEQMTNVAAMVTRLFSKAVNQGDLNAARTIIEWAGMAPLQEARENEAIAKMSQVMQLVSGNEKDDDDNDVVFYIPDNGRPIITDDDIVTDSE